jgi:hypothetical protein
MMSSDDIHFTLDQLLKRPVAFFPVFAKIGGSVNAGIMLSQLWYWSDGRAWNKEGWIWKTAPEWAKETALSESEVEGGRKKLVERGLIQYKRAGLPAKPHYLLNKQAILEAVTALQTHAASLPDSGKQVESDSTTKTDEKHDSGLPNCGEHNTEITPESSSEITTTTYKTAGGAGVKSDPLLWEDGELKGSIDDFVNAALWIKCKFEVVRNHLAYKSSVRKRVTIEGPNAEDWETLALWRASQTKPAPSVDPEAAKRDAEKKQQLADAKQRYVTLEVSQQKEIESRFAAHLQATNTFVYQAYQKSGLQSGMVAGTFHGWLVEELL